MKISRRSFLKGTAAVAAAIPFIKAERLMNVWTPPEPEIFTGYSAPAEIVTQVDYNFQLSGLIPGAKVIVKNEITGETVISEQVKSREMRWNVPENMGGAPLSVVVFRDYDHTVYQNRVGSPYPGGKTKIRAGQFIKMKGGFAHA